MSKRHDEQKDTTEFKETVAAPESMDEWAARIDARLTVLEREVENIIQRNCLLTKDRA